MMRELAKRKGVEVIEGNACPDHIHLVLSIPPRASVAQIIGFMKGKSAIRLHMEFGRNHNNLQQKSFWSRGYYVSTVGINREQIIKYVQDQWKRDKFIDGPELDLYWR
jgi:putative transposase